MSDRVISIHDKSFNELIMKFYNIKENLNETFETLNSLVESLKGYYETDSSKVLVDNYFAFAEYNYAAIMNNMDSYITDLKTAREKYDIFDTKISMQIREDTLAIKNENRKEGK